MPMTQKPTTAKKTAKTNLASALPALPAVLAVVILAGILFFAWLPSQPRPQTTLAGKTTPTGNSPFTPTALNETIVLAYNGTRLDAPSVLRENSINGPQYVDRLGYRLQIYGLVERPVNLTYDEVVFDASALPHYSKVVELDCVEGWSANLLWEGVLVKDLVARAGGASAGANTVIFHAADGYTTSFPLTYFDGSGILLAYRQDNLSLTPATGFPFQLVAESKWGYKWIKWVTGIELSNDAGYKGYWESRGYSNEGVPQRKLHRVKC
ncbi:MAG: molybdopterin-dependent oxidoreductase [Candidatus Micrarchaeota archaeon]